MKLKRFIIIAIIVIIVIGIVLALRKYKEEKRADVKIAVLLYHDFVKTVPKEDPDDFNYINTPEGFEENIQVLLESGYTPISLEELNEAYNLKTKLPAKPILITFDDGYYSNYEYIYPILKKYNVKASVFIVTDQVGKEIDGKKYLGWNECQEMQESGLVKIYSHGKRHVFYNKLPPKEIYNDVNESYELIEERLGDKSFRAFAYPYGAYTRETVWALKFSGIDMQVYDLGINNFKNLNKDYIKRINIPCEMTGKEIIEEIEKN